MKRPQLLTKSVKCLENSKHPSMGPIIWSIKMAGMWRSENGINKALIVQSFAVLTLVTELIELWLLKSDLTNALRNLSLTTLSITCVVKSGTFVLWHKDWRSITEFVSFVEIEQRLNSNKYTNKIMAEYIQYSRRITYLYWFLTYSTVFAVIIAPLIGCFTSSEWRDMINNGSAPYPEIISSWVPFDKSRGHGYVILVSIQILMVIYGGVTVATYDSNAVTLMAFFTGQLRILEANCSMLFEEKPSYEDSVKLVREWHCHHINLIKYSKIFDSVLSPVLFLYIIICSLMICASAVQLTKEGISTIQQFWIAEYLGALITQLFLYCWHSHQVYAMSLRVSEGVYMSSWWSQELKMQRNVFLLCGQLKRIIEFSAGPFTKLNITTFIAILKGSYSYYTFLNKK